MFVRSHFSFRAACAPLVKWQTRPPTKRFPWCSSAHLNLHAGDWYSLLYERAASQLPTLCVCPVENVLGSVPLMLSLLSYLKGNLNNTIPHSLWNNVPAGAAADFRPNSGTGSRLFKVNMWRYGRALPRKISVEDAEEMRPKRVQELL
jgi:hypothetical protein